MKSFVCMNSLVIVRSIMKDGAGWKMEARIDSDPMMEFLTDEQFIILDESSIVPLAAFRSLYNDFRNHYNMEKQTRWSEDVYRVPFNENGVSLHKNQTIDWEGVTQTGVDAVHGVRFK